MNEQERMQVLINDLKDLGFFEEVVHADDHKATLQEAALCLSIFLIDGELDSIGKQDESLLEKGRNESYRRWKPGQGHGAFVPAACSGLTSDSKGRA